MIRQFISNIQHKVQGYYFRPKISGWVFLGILFILGFIYQYHEILFLRPQSIHVWRQTDCLSIALNYYQQHNPFLEPSLCFLGADGTGKTMSEFPILNYTAAKLWSVFGYHEFIYRLLVLSISFTALVLLFKTTEKILSDSYWAILVCVLLFTSPILVFYSNNFLANVPALSFVFIAWFFFYKYYKNGQNSFFILACVFFTLAGLLKASASVSYVSLFLIYLLERSKLIEFRKGAPVFSKSIWTFLLLIAPFIVLSGRYVYADYYNTKYNGGIFLVGIHPYWEADEQKIKDVIHTFWDLQVKWSYLKPTSLTFMFISMFVLFFNYKRVNKFLYFLLLFVFIGFLLFIPLFFQALHIHDYYMIDFLIFIPLIFITLLLTLKEKYPGFYNSIILRLLAFILLFGNIDFARRRMRDRYSSEGWMNEWYVKYYHAFAEIGPTLDELNIKKEDKVICLPDGTFNISLYLMNRRGWTGFGMDDFADSTKINQYKNLGAKYLMVYDSTLLRNENLKPFTTNPIGDYKFVHIYKL